MSDWDGVERRVDSHRLDRIERKIDDLSEAMISLARAEEKLISIEKNNFANYERMNKHSQKLDEIEKKVNENTATVQVINRVFWLAVSIGATALAAQLTGILS